MAKFQSRSLKQIKYENGSKRKFDKIVALDLNSVSLGYKTPDINPKRFIYESTPLNENDCKISENIKTHRKERTLKEFVPRPKLRIFINNNNNHFISIDPYKSETNYDNYRIKPDWVHHFRTLKYKQIYPANVTEHYDVVKIKPNDDKENKNIEIGFGLDYTNIYKDRGEYDKINFREKFARVCIFSNQTNKMIFDSWLVKANTKKCLLRYEKYNKGINISVPKNSSSSSSSLSSAKRMFENWEISRELNDKQCSFTISVLTGRVETLEKQKIVDVVRDKFSYYSNNDDDDDDDDVIRQAVDEFINDDDEEEKENKNIAVILTPGEQTNQKIVRNYKFVYDENAPIDIYNFVIVYDDDDEKCNCNYYSKQKMEARKIKKRRLAIDF